MESTYLRTLIEVARTGNLTRAADTLCVTQSAVSRRIKFLEDQYGYLLLDRSGPVLVPTPEGALVLEKAQKILDIERELLSGLTALEKKKGLSFLCTPTFGIVHLPDILREFMLNCAEAGDLKFVFDMPENIVKALKGGLYEMAIIEHCECFDLSDFRTVSLPGDEMIFAAAPSRGMGKEVDVETLLAQTLFGRNEGCCSRTLLEKNLSHMNRSTADIRKVVVYDDLHLIVRAVIEGDGVAFISSDLVQPYVESGELGTFRVSGFNHQRLRTFVLNNNFAGCSLAAQFVETVFARFPQACPEELEACCGT
jgi:DNA-binding transcriptional LysR family regulator